MHPLMSDAGSRSRRRRRFRQFSARSACAVLRAFVQNCQACRSGEQHRSWVLYGRAKERLFSIYVPEDLVPKIQRCLDKGRALQELLFEAAPRYVQALKREKSKFASKQEN